MSDLKQAAQKVVDAWGDPLGMKHLCEEIEALRAALEKTEPRREWQGLTDEEVLRTLKWDEAMAPIIAKGMPTEVLEAAKREAIERHRAVEAKLKERNHE